MDAEAKVYSQDVGNFGNGDSIGRQVTQVLLGIQSPKHLSASHICSHRLCVLPVPAVNTIRLPSPPDCYVAVFSHFPSSSLKSLLMKA
ncbi:hypothetical protein LWI28_019231 [Acer negundo]|uniref:Uncharacterized protein n=1 Tax=Acer negundo TaxID=4023 RepID=A0AAD5JMJ3_ACENE|nr:hypothetical protein LWI28_019231 [Acer negundo]